MHIIVIGGVKDEQENVVNLLKNIDAVAAIAAFEKFSRAKTYLEQYTVDLALLDVEHEELHWSTVFKKIKLINKAVKVVLLSKDESAAVKAHEIGISNYLLRPVKQEQLEKLIRNVR